MESIPRGITNDRSIALQHDVRFIGNISGCYFLASRRDDDTGRARVFACRTQSVSPDAIVIEAPVRGAVGEKVAIKLTDLGILSGRIERLFTAGFSMMLNLPGDERTKLAAKLNWMKKRQLRKLPEKRENKRRLPHNPSASLLLLDGTRLESFIIDMSRSGVAISADTRPALGTPVAVGRLLGRVVRHLDAGFAVQFASVQEDVRLEAELTTDAIENLSSLSGQLKAFADC